MGPEEAEPAPEATATPEAAPSTAAEPAGDPRAARAARADDDAFAATIAPTLSSNAGPPSPARPPASPLESDETMAAPAPAIGEIPDLPVVSDGCYQTDREIARGGMGRIVAADDQRLGRRVAIKELIDPAPDQRGRFVREALITARLQHPGIVPVYEAGRWPSGEPFFAMKLVSGTPLDQVIGQARTLQDRLGLLPRIAAAADAIAYAHSQRVIHRDLKPGNVLIGNYGETVVIDWGLAKDLDAQDSPESTQRTPAAKRPATAATSDASTLTVAGAVMGTPAYMAPEQARGEPLGPRADVFALGAMLYHVLAGVPPYNARTATEVIAAAALGRVVPLIEREPRTPHDLLAIVNRAMAQEPLDRYQDAGELAEELRRFMTGQLVAAHHYTALQKLGRFVRRHRAAVTISALSITAFTVFGTLALRQIIEQRDAAQTAREIADTRRLAAETLIDNMLTDVKDRLAKIGRLDVLSNLGGEIRDYYDAVNSMTIALTPADQDRMATAINLVAMAERDSGRLDQALRTWTEVRATLARSIGADRSVATVARRRMIAQFDFEIGTVHQQRGKIQAAIKAFTEAKRSYDLLKDEAPRDRLVLVGAAETHDKLGDLLRNEGKIDAALEEYLQAKADRELAGSQTSSRPSEEVLALSTSHMKLGSVYLARGDSAAALQSFRSGLRLRETLLESEADNVHVIEKVLDAQNELAELQRSLGDDKSAIQTYHEAIVVSDGLARRDSTNTLWKRQRGNLRANLGFALLDVGEFRAGLEQLQSAIENQRELVAHDPKSQAWQGDLSRFYTRAGDGKLYLGEHDKGVVLYRSALTIRQRLARSDTNSTPYRRSVAWSYAKLANAHAAKGELGTAIEHHERALELRAALVSEAPAHSGFRNELASTEITLAKVIAARDPRRGRELLKTGLSRARALVAGDPINGEWKETLTQGLIAEAELARVTGDRAARATVLTEARVLAEAAAARAPRNVHWQAYLGEIHLGLAEAAPDAKTAAAERKAVVDRLLPLAQAGRLPATRNSLLDRARGGR